MILARFVTSTPLTPLLKLDGGIRHYCGLNLETVGIQGFYERGQ